MPNEITLTLKSFYENLFQKDIKKSVFDIESFLSQTQLPIISDENYANCETDITKDNIFVAVKSMPDNNCPVMQGRSYRGAKGAKAAFQILAKRCVFFAALK